MSEFIIQIEKLFSAFSDAEYRYLLLEPLIFYGILIGVCMLVAGFFLKAPKLQIAALITVGATALAHVPYKEARLAAQPRMEQVYKISSPSRVKGFNATTDGWVEASWKFRLLVLAAVLALMIGINRNKIGFSLGIATACLGMIAAKDAMWFHYQDAIAYHPNLKKHVAPIDERPRTPAPSRRTVERTPSQATSQPVAPASSLPSYSPTQPYSAPSNPAVSSLPRDRIPRPEVPGRIQQRPVTPLYR